ncbi:von Willebrand factor A domain-containing protein 5A-like isoform X2 [Sceloporus undulatus]|uniref:von Willebrand factor A domain-containing protein 5A-like isoform X2 n=1 Tax=Sceloporus undulatus TaxID=8520 RepID=UPI001C4B3AAC|nr:von Willebrand factor A domain-containing protein 5A-like isoform X2 [Sceloporus undulatus]
MFFGCFDQGRSSSKPPRISRRSSSAMTTVCGLLTKSQQPVPLKGISVDVLVQGFIADVVSELRYKNEEKTPVEAVFVFPLDDEAAVYAFEGVIGGTRIEAQIREKKQAEEEYEDALSEGREAFMLGREENTSDIFTCSLGNLPPEGEATLKLRYVQALAPEPDGAIRFVLPAVLNPRYVPQGSEGTTVTQNIARVPKGQLPYTLSLSATVESTYGINRIESKCTLEPLRYIAEDRTSAQVSLAEGHQFDKDVEFLIHYEDVHKPSAFFEAGKPGVAPGSLMGDPALLLTLYPNITTSKPGQNATGEFIFLLDRSGSMDCNTDHSQDSPLRIQSAKETLILLLKSLPLGCYFNIYGFGSTYDSFYPQSVEYTQKTMSESLERIKNLKADLGGTEILQPLKAIYSQPCREGHPRQLFIFTDGEVHNTNEVIDEVKSHSNSHRCFSFGIGEGASTALIKGVARAAGGSAEFITGKERMQAKALQSLKKALQPAVTKISLNWDLPPDLEAVVVGSGPQVIFQGQRCLIYAQIRGQHQSSHSTEGTAVLHYAIQDQTFMEKAKFSLSAQEKDRFPVHRLAAQALLQELDGAEEMDKKHLALETSLSSGVVCSQTAYVGVNTELGKPIQGPLIHRNIPVAYQGFSSAAASFGGMQLMCSMPLQPQLYAQRACRKVGILPKRGKLSKHISPKSDRFEPRLHDEPAEKESPLLNLVSLQNVDGSWLLDSGLARILGHTETTLSKTPSQVAPNVWATVLAILWLHSKASEQRDEWELLEAKALNWLQVAAGPQLTDCVKAGNALLGTSVSPQIFGL